MAQIEPFYFIQAADTQLGLIDWFFEKKISWDKELALIEKMIDKVNQMQPKPSFLIICGDMVNEFPESEHREAQLADHKKVFDKLDKTIPLVCVCGNHDVGDKPTPDTITKYRSDFGPDYLTFVVNEVLMIILNSQYYMDPELVPEQAAEHDKWLDGVLQSIPKYKKAIVFQHIPWFCYNPEDERTVFILDNGHKVFFDMDLDVRKKMLNKLYDAGIRDVFCGHYHRNAGGHFKDMQQVVTSAVGAALGQDKSGFRIVTLNKDAVVKHKYYELDQVPTSITLE